MALVMETVMPATLALAALIWIGVHAGIAGTRLRWTLALRFGENGFRAAFSVLSVAAIAFLIASYRAAPTTPFWVAPLWLRWLLALLMLAGFMLFVGSVATRNPTMVGGERVAGQHVRGMLRITRHPMLWSFALWAAVHVIGSGDSASLLFFGAFLVTALLGMPSIDAKVARRDPEGWRGLAAETSILPFAAIAQGRNRFVPGEIGWVVPVLGAGLWALLLWLHPAIFGANPLAG
jgi:uncharacterized membrane protein